MEVAALPAAPEGFLPGVVIVLIGWLENSFLLVGKVWNIGAYICPRYPCHPDRNDGTRYLREDRILLHDLETLWSHDKLTWNQNVLVMFHKVLQDRCWVLYDVDVPPIDPVVHRSQGRVEEIVPRAPDGLAPRPLGAETMSLLDALAGGISKVLLDDSGASETLRVGFGLETVKLRVECRQGVIFAVAD